ncbi:MAG TPA: acyl transferase [Chitinophagaceae bacterium]|nr:acyl transferase [Chitinophagaceae bacterium]
MKSEWNDKIFRVNEQDREGLALEIFRFQYKYTTIYRQYVDALGIDPHLVNRISKIPFLPIRFFKSHAVQAGVFEPALIFESSGTTGSINSRHLIKDAGLYEESFTLGFERFYGPASNWCVIGLLPSYLERQNSSLVYMVNELIRQSAHPQSGFYLNEYEKLADVLSGLEEKAKPTLLIGVTFGLLDFAESRKLPALRHTTVMETGGMKGRRRELVRQEVHDLLSEAFKIQHIHSEYGMTELLSQAYSKGNGLFACPPWMQVLVRDEADPLSILQSGGDHPVTGAVNIIDLANVYSCSFIATDDAAKVYPDGSFEVLGRLDNSDIRGCSLMAV